MGMILVHPEKTQFGTEERVVIQADTLPETMPTTGRNVTGLPDGCTILPASLMYVLATGKKYVMDSEGEWQEFVGSSGGGGGYPEPTGTLQVTSNGLVNVKDWAQANVNVSGNGLGVHDIRFVHAPIEAYNVSGFFSDLMADSREVTTDNEIKFRMNITGENDFTISLDFNGSNTDLSEIINTYNSAKSFSGIMSGSSSSDVNVEFYSPWNVTRFDDMIIESAISNLKKLYIRGDASMYSNCTIDGTSWQNSVITDVYVPWAQADRDISTEDWFQAIGQDTGTPATAHYNTRYDQTTGELITG